MSFPFSGTQPSLSQGRKAGKTLQPRDSHSERALGYRFLRGLQQTGQSGREYRATKIDLGLLASSWGLGHQHIEWVNASIRASCQHSVHEDAQCSRAFQISAASSTLIFLRFLVLTLVLISKSSIDLSSGHSKSSPPLGQPSFAPFLPQS